MLERTDFQRIQDRYWEGTLPAAMTTAMNSFTGWSWGVPSQAERDWRLNADDTLAYRERENAWPSAKSDNPVVRRRGKWLDTTRQAARKGTLTPERRKYLDDRAPGWDADQQEILDRQWFENADETLAYCEREKKWPSPTSDNPVVKRHGIWLNTTRQAAKKGTLSPERRKYLDDRAPGWDADQQEILDQQWFENADDTLTYREREKKWPSKYSDDPVVKRRGVWLDTTRQAARKGTLTPERRKYLDDRAPGWEASDKQGILDRQWFENADETLAYRERENTWPSRTSDNPVARRLSKWLSTTRHAAKKGTLAPARRKYLDDRAPGWDADQQEILDRQWFENADDTLAYRERENTWPSTKSDNPVVKRRGKWLDKTRQAARKGTLAPARRKYMDDRAPGWETAAGQTV